MVEATTEANEDYNTEIFMQFKERATQTLTKIAEEQKVTDDTFSFSESQKEFYLENEQLLRFLRARDFKMEPTTKMHDQWVRWRLSYKADQIRPSQIRDMLLRETMMLGPPTKDGCITLFIRPRYHVPGANHIDDLVRYGIFIVEQAINRIKAENLDPRLACIYDRTGMTNQNKDG